MKIIVGKQLFNQEGITVTQCDNCYIVSNGQEVSVFTFLPQLNISSLKKLFATSDPFEKFQLAKYKSVMKDPMQFFKGFSNWLNEIASQAEMHSIGY